MFDVFWTPFDTWVALGCLVMIGGGVAIGALWRPRRRENAVMVGAGLGIVGLGVAVAIVVNAAIPPIT